jgi:hypothetical protein
VKSVSFPGSEICSHKQREEARGSQYKSPHFDEPNVLAHVRFNDRTIDGKKTLFIEEVQSDWGQSLRRAEATKNKAIESNFLGITLEMEKAGLLKMECD